MKTDAKPLRAAIELLRPVVKERILPVLGCFKLEATDGKLSVTVTDLDQFQIEVVECDGDLPPICVNAIHLSGCLPVDGAVNLKFDKQLEIKFGKSKFKLNTLDASEFPPIPDTKDCKLQGLSVPDLAEGIKSVAWAASRDEIRQVLNSVHVLSKPKMLLCESSDGRNGAFFERPLVGCDMEMLVPDSFASRLNHALLRDGAELRVSPNSVFVSHPAGGYHCKQLESRYPNTSEIRQYKQDKLGEVEAAPVLTALDSCLSLTDPNKTPEGTLEFGDDGLKIGLLAVGEANLIVPGTFKPHKARVNMFQFKRCLRAVGNCQIFNTADGMGLSMRSGDLLVMSMNLRGQAT